MEFIGSVRPAAWCDEARGGGALADRARRRRILRRPARRGADRGAARARPRRPLLRHGRARRWPQPAARRGRPPTSCRRHGSVRGPAAPAAAAAAAPLARRRASSEARPDVFVGIDVPGLQSRPRQKRLKAQRLAHGAVREPAGVGVASGPGADDRPAPAISCCACCRSRRTSMPSTACARSSSAIRSQIRFRWTSIATARGARCGSTARCDASWRSCRAAGWARSSGSRADFCGGRGLDRRAPARTSGSSRRWLSRRVRERFEASACAATPARLPSLVLDGQAQRALAAADGAIVASGTATLETLLTGRPMVVAYRFGALTALLLRRLGLVKVPYFSQPNLLIGAPPRAGVLPGGRERRGSGRGAAAQSWRIVERVERAAAGISQACTRRCGAAAPSARPRRFSSTWRARD